MFGDLHIDDAHSLFLALDRRAEAPAAFDAAVWDRVGAEGAILVTDLSGFTKTTRAHGILHFLWTFRRFQNRCLPLIEAFGGSLLKQEADDLFGAFPSGQAAIGCGIAMLREVEAMNEGAPPEARVGLSLGVEWGRMLRLADDAFGDPVNVAFKLGEDMAEPGELLVGHGAFAHAAGFDWAGCEVSAPRRTEIGGVVVEHYAVRLQAAARPLT